MGPINYSSVNQFIIGAFSLQTLIMLSQNKAKVTILLDPRLAGKPALIIIGGEGSQQILEIGGVTLTSQLYKLENLVDTKEKEKGIWLLNLKRRRELMRTKH